MLKKLVALFLFAISLFSLAIFAVVPISASQFTNRPEAQPCSVPSPVSVGWSANGTTINLAVNQTLVISLASNPSGTGFSWNLDQINTAVLENVDNQYVPPSPPHFGGSGTEVWTFRATSVGSSPIVMQYRQPWPGGDQGPIFQLTVNVTAAPVPASSNLTIGILIAGLAVLIGWLALRNPVHLKRKRLSKILSL